jgi:hypothetical protein
VPPLPSVHAVKKSGGLLPKINPKFARDFCVYFGDGVLGPVT